MKRILVWFLILSFSGGDGGAGAGATPPTASLTSSPARFIRSSCRTRAGGPGKRLEALEKEIGDLQGQVDPGRVQHGDLYDLKKLAEQVREIDRKRQEDDWVS